MWIRTEKERLLNLNNVDYLDVRQSTGQGQSQSWNLVAVFIVDGGRTLSVNDTVIVVRQGKSNAEMAAVLEDIEKQLTDGNTQVYKTPVKQGLHSPSMSRFG